MNSLGCPDQATPRTAAGPSRILKFVAAVIGLLLMAVAGFANYTGEYIFAAYGKAFVRLPGMLPGQYYFFSVWWVLAGLPLALFGFGWLFPAFRDAVRAPWRRTRYAAPLLASLVLFVVTMIPAEYLSTPSWDTGTRMIFYVVVAGTGLVLFLAGGYRWLRFLDSPMKRLEQWLMGLGRWQFMLLIAGFTFLVANLVSYFVFEHMPHIQDSIAQVFQGRIFAQGKLFLSSPKFPDFFDYTHIINNGQWYSQYLFLHSLFLMLGVFIGAPWVINPLLGALTVPLIYLLGRDLYGERTGRWAGVLASLCPFIFNMSSEFMNHSGTLLFATLFLLFFFRTVRATAPKAESQSPGSRVPGNWHHPVIAGIALGLVANIRPYTALAFAVPFAVYGLWRIVREPGRYLTRFLLMIVAAAAVTGLIFVYNWLTNGNPLLWGYVVKWGPGHEVGFGKSGWGAFHTPYRGMVNTLNNLNQVNKFLFEWPLPALVPIAVLFASGTIDKRDRLLLAGFVCLVAAHFFYWFQNVCFGPRFLYASAGCLVILTVRGGGQLGPFLRRTCRVPVSDGAVATFVRRVWPMMTAIMIGVGLPPLFRSYHMYAGVSGDLVRTVKRAGLKNALVFCHHLGHGFSANTLGLDGDVVYAKDYGIANAALTLAYPDRSYYYGNRDTLRPLDGISYQHSQLKRALDEMGAFLQDTMVRRYRTVIWPFEDIPPPDFGGQPRIVDPREASREIFTGRKKLDDYLPAIACWLVGDEREHLAVFSLMNDLQNVIAGGYRFTLLLVTGEGTGAVYEISTATGDEFLVPDQASPVPVR